jgi:hypothetical protein
MNTTATTLPTIRTYTRRGTRPGSPVVSRTILDTGTRMFFEITLMRSPGQRNATFQGTVVLLAGRWHAQAPTAGTAIIDAGTFADYVDAENALVTRVSRLRSAQQWTGPRPTKPVRPSCRVCGNTLTAGACRRTDLHWSTPEEINHA